MPEPTHQLVIQFPQSVFPAFDDLVDYEDALIEVLGNDHEVDGHDIGSGEVNFFIFTADPARALSTVHDASLLAHAEVRVAARPVDGERYEVLWPVGDDREFDLA